MAPTNRDGERERSLASSRECASGPRRPWAPPSPAPPPRLTVLHTRMRPNVRKVPVAVVPRGRDLRHTKIVKSAGFGVGAKEATLLCDRSEVLAHHFVHRAMMRLGGTRLVHCERGSRSDELVVVVVGSVVRAIPSRGAEFESRRVLPSLWHASALRSWPGPQGTLEDNHWPSLLGCSESPRLCWRPCGFCLYQSAR